MSDDSTNTEETETPNITDAYGEAIEYDGNPAHAEGYLAAMDEFFLNSERCWASGKNPSSALQQ